MWKERLSCWALLIFQTTLSQVLRSGVSIPFRKAKEAWGEFAKMTFYWHMYAHVIKLRCTGLHIITALRVLFFLLETSTSTKKHKETPFHLDISRHISTANWGPLLRRCSRVHKLWTTPGQIQRDPERVWNGPGNSEIKTATLACEEEGCTIWGWTWMKNIGKQPLNRQSRWCFRNLLTLRIFSLSFHDIPSIDLV